MSRQGVDNLLGQIFAQLIMNRVESQAQPKIPSKFFQQEDGAAKIRFCLKKKENKGHLPPASEVFQPKNDAASKEARKNGNEYFKAKEYVSAMDLYNRSLCLAKTTQNLGMGYANRSAVYFYSGFYKYCLENIELALANDYPEEFRGKLMKRKEECLKMMKTRVDSLVKYDKDYNPMGLSYTPNKKIPMMIEALEFAESREFGRFIRTKKDLKPGDVLIIEKSFTKYIGDNCEYKHCANCLGQNYMNLFPCKNCTRTMYCSKSCQQEAARCHKYECKVIDALLDLNSSIPVIFTALHATIQSVKIFDDPQKLQELITEIADKNEAFHVDYANLTEEQHFRAAYSLATNESKKEPEELYRFSKKCAIVWHLLCHYTDLCDFLNTKAMEDMFLNLFFHFVLVSIVNSHQLGHPTVELGDMVTYGNGIFTLSHLINHSCLPNVFQSYDKGTIMIMAKSNIKAGEQLFYMYGPDVYHGYANLENRQKKLRIQYDFECKCEACRFDYPLMSNMPVPRGMFKEKITSDMFALIRIEPGFAQKKFKEYKKFIMEYKKKMPTFELLSAEAMLKQSTWVMMFGRPLEMQLKPI